MEAGSLLGGRMFSRWSDTAYELDEVEYMKFRPPMHPRSAILITALVLFHGIGILAMEIPLTCKIRHLSFTLHPEIIMFA